MLEFEHLVYLDPQKTATSRIIKLLRVSLDEPVVFFRKHLRHTGPKKDKYYLSSSRSPWSYYYSLFTFGLAGGGSPYGLRGRIDRAGRGDLYRPDPAAFREWLVFINEPDNIELHGEGYPELAPPDMSMGLATFRFVAMNLTDTDRDLRALTDADAIREHFARHALTDFVIDQDNFDVDVAMFFEIYRTIGNVKPGVDVTKLAERKVNASPKVLGSVHDAYDDEARDLVAARDRFLIEHFGYEF
jgi:hypothetical protein